MTAISAIEKRVRRKLLQDGLALCKPRGHKKDTGRVESTHRDTLQSTIGNGGMVGQGGHCEYNMVRNILFRVVPLFRVFDNPKYIKT